MQKACLILVERGYGVNFQTGVASRQDGDVQIIIAHGKTVHVETGKAMVISNGTVTGANIEHIPPNELDHAYKVARAMRNVCKMLSVRGYTVEPITSKNSFLACKDSDTIHVAYIKKVGTSTIVDMTTYLELMQINHAILLSDVKWSTQAQARLPTHINYENFTLAELQIDKIKNPLVPKHVLLDKSPFDPRILPRMYVTDPIAKYYNAQIGQVFLIERPSLTAGKSDYYRVITKPPLTKSSTNAVMLDP